MPRRLVTEAESRIQARNRLPSLIILGSEGRGNDWHIDNFRSVAGAILSDPALEIFDVEGNLLFRDYTQILDRGSELRVRTSASRLLGAPVISSGIRSEPLPIGEWLRKAASIFESQGIDGEDRLVCHSYPYLGLLRRRGAESWLIEFMDWSIIPVKSPQQAGIWSPFSVIRDDQVARLVLQWSVKYEQLLTREWKSFSDLKRIVEVVRDEIERVVLDNITLNAQDDSWSCVPATAKMILDYHKIVYSEPELKDIMKTVDGIGTTAKDELNGYRKATKEAFTVQVDLPDFELARTEIGIKKKGWPVGSGIEREKKHARAAVGWEVGRDGSLLLIYDPWPVANVKGYGGNPYWEEWVDDYYLHTDFVIVRPE